MDRPIVDNYTWESYKNLLRLLEECGYEFATFNDYEEYEKPCILRHDIDVSLDRALRMAHMEASCPGLRSTPRATYFILITGDWYNAFSIRAKQAIEKLLALGHEVGLHFDDMKYEWHDDYDLLAAYVRKEADMLSEICDCEIKTFSTHKSPKLLLDGRLKVEGLANAYDDIFFKQFKYLSDSAMTWREDAHSVIISGEHSGLQVLTHPIWYSTQYRSKRDQLMHILKQGARQRYTLVGELVPDIDMHITEEDILRIEK